MSTIGPLGRAFRGRRIALLAGFLVLALVVFGLRDVRRREPDAVSACLEYVGLVDTCMGKDAAARLARAYAKPPAAEEARKTMARECTASHDRLRRACR